MVLHVCNTRNRRNIHLISQSTDKSRKIKFIFSKQNKVNHTRSKTNSLFGQRGCMEACHTDFYFRNLRFYSASRIDIMPNTASCCLKKHDIRTQSKYFLQKQ